jgi:hypothetical protein
VHAITCRSVVVVGFPQEEDAVAEEPGGEPHEASRILMCLVLFIFTCVNCVLRVGSCMMVIG